MTRLSPREHGRFRLLQWFFARSSTCPEFDFVKQLKTVEPGRGATFCNIWLQKTICRSCKGQEAEAPAILRADAITSRASKPRPERDGCGEKMNTKADQDEGREGILAAA